MAFTFYAVQVGDNYDWDYGNEDYDTAVRMAKQEAEDKDNVGMQVRIATIDTKYNVCDGVKIIKDGWCG